MMAPPPASQSDGELLRRIASDVDAFDEFYRRYEPIVLAFLRRRTGSSERAADLAADTFVEAVRASRRFKDNGRPAAGWLLAIANHMLLRQRDRAGSDARLIARLGLERPVHSAESLEQVDALLDLRAGRNPLIEALLQLPPEQQTAIRAFVIDEQPYHEIATALGVHEGTLRQRVRRGLLRLKATIPEASA